MAIRKQIKEVSEYYYSVCTNNSAQNVNTLTPKFKKAIHELEVIDNAITQKQYSSVKTSDESVLIELRNNINRLENKLIKLGEENGRLKERLELLTKTEQDSNVREVDKEAIKEAEKVREPEKKEEKATKVKEDIEESKLINGIKSVVPDEIEKKVKINKGYAIGFEGRFIRRKYKKEDVVRDYQEHHTITKGMRDKYGVCYHTLRELLIKEGVWEFKRVKGKE